MDVLLIDDDEWLTQIFSFNLNKEGFFARIARDGIEAIDLINKKIPDVIVLDIFMPGPNGIVLMHELQSYADLSSIPIILCTNSAYGVDIEDLRLYGVVSVLDKMNMDPLDIVSEVKKLYYEHREN